METKQKNFRKSVLGIGLALGLVLGPVVGRAQDMGSDNAQVAPAPSLQQVMRDLGARFQELAPLTRDAANFPQALTVHQQILLLAEQSLQLLPAKVEALPEPDKSRGAIVYKKLIVKLLDTSLDLESELRGGTTATVGAALQKVVGVMREGHQLFKN